MRDIPPRRECQAVAAGLSQDFLSISCATIRGGSGRYHVMVQILKVRTGALFDDAKVRCALGPADPPSWVLVSDHYVPE